jgi:VanZ family protein
MLVPSRPIRLALVLAWMVLETFWSSQSNLPIDHPPISTLLFGLQHRVAHLVAFGVLALLARWAFEGFPRARLLAILLTSAFGATDELHQIFTPRRHPGVDDWAVDTLAACLAMLAWPRVFGEGRRVVRTLVPAVIASVFVLETVVLGLSAAHLRLPAELRRATAQVVPTEAKQAARDFAHSTRSFVSRL